MAELLGAVSLLGAAAALAALLALRERAKTAEARVPVRNPNRNRQK